jgi:predicted ABC-type ATPase
VIAAELSPGHPERVAMTAGRSMLAAFQAAVARGESFAFETTLSDRSHVHRITGWRSAGYHVSLWFLSLPSPQSAIARVAERVVQGGHSVPDIVIRRRFAAGLAHFEGLYKELVDAWVLYDNAGDQPILLDWGENR